MNYSPRLKVSIDFKEDVLCVRFQENSPFPDHFGPALDHRNHDLVNNERFRLDAHALDHLHEQRWMSAMLEISSVKGEVGNHESVGLVRPRYCFPHQKSPRVLTIAIGESESIGKVGEPVQVHVCQVT